MRCIIHELIISYKQHPLIFPHYTPSDVNKWRSKNNIDSHTQTILRGLTPVAKEKCRHIVSFWGRFFQLHYLDAMSIKYLQFIKDVVILFRVMKYIMHTNYFG